jgi:hypothetical protein
MFLLPKCLLVYVSIKLQFLKIGHAGYKKNPFVCVDFENINSLSDKMHKKVFGLEKWPYEFGYSGISLKVYTFEFYSK